MINNDVIHQRLHNRARAHLMNELMTGTHYVGWSRWLVRVMILKGESTLPASYTSYVSTGQRNEERIKVIFATKTTIKMHNIMQE